MPTITIPQNTNLAGLFELLVNEQGHTKAASETVKEHKDNEEVIEQAILAKIAETGVDRVSHAGYTAKREELVYGNIKDYDALIKFIHRNKYYHLLERRVAVLAFREMLGIKGAVPGVEPVTKVKLSFRKNPS